MGSELDRVICEFSFGSSEGRLSGFREVREPHLVLPLAEGVTVPVGYGRPPGEVGAPGPGAACDSLSLQNVEMLSSMDSASVRIVKPFPAPQAPGRPQPLQAAPAPPPPVPAAPKLDHQRMDTIQEDPSTDSHVDEDPFPSSSTAAKSFEDLTGRPVTRSEKASSFKLQRQNRVGSKETEC